MTSGKGRYVFTDWRGPAIPVWTYVPTTAEKATAPIVIVMHGVNRDADRYRDEWADVAEQFNFIVITPEISNESFPGAVGYNLGAVFEDDLRTRRDFQSSAFAAIEPLFADAIRRLRSNQTQYTIYGHSAGSQFVHRFLYYVPDASAKRYISANAGWYTLPTFKEDFPYGFSNSGLSVSNLSAALQRDVIVMLGDRDTSESHPNLRRTPEAMRQGPHRMARGHYFYNMATEKATAMGLESPWQLRIVPGAMHKNSQMTSAAAKFVE